MERCPACGAEPLVAHGDACPVLRERRIDAAVRAARSHSMWAVAARAARWHETGPSYDVGLLLFARRVREEWRRQSTLEALVA